MKIQAFHLMYENQKRIGIRPLGFDQSFPTLMKKIPGNRWTPNEKCWHIPYEKRTLISIGIPFLSKLGKEKKIAIPYYQRK